MPLPNNITTDRLQLRPPVIADAEAIFEAYGQDPQVCRFMVWAPHASISATRAFVGSCIEAWDGGDRLAYIVTPHGSDTAIGMVEARVMAATIDIGYVLARSRWGSGLMPEALTALTSTALGQPAFFRVQATCDVANVASQRALEKAGFEREGRLERHTVHPNISLEPRPCFMYAKCR